MAIDGSTAGGVIVPADLESRELRESSVVERHFPCCDEARSCSLAIFGQVLDGAGAAGTVCADAKSIAAMPHQAKIVLAGIRHVIGGPCHSATALQCHRCLCFADAISV